MLAGCVTTRPEKSAPVVVWLGAPSELIAARGIHLALIGRHWEIERDRPGEVIAKIVHSEQKVRIRITYNRTTASIYYMAGVGTRRDMGVDPRKYERWVDNLAKDLVVTVKTAAALAAS